MGSVNAPIMALNAGIVGEDALGRIDLSKMRMAAQTQKNLLPTVLGPAKFRPGTEYADITKDFADAYIIPFVFNITTKALLELTDGYLRIILDGEPLARPSVTASVANPNFATDLASWTDADEAGAVSDRTSDGMRLTGTGSTYAIRRQQVTVTETGTEHALRITIHNGPVRFKVGSASGLDDYIEETSLATGVHDIGFTPTGNFHITVSSSNVASRTVKSIFISDVGAVKIPTPWSAGLIPSVRYAQSGDVLFCACDGVIQKRIERRSQRSWSVVNYLPIGGPFRFENTEATTITPSAVTGNVTLTASAAVFETDHVGALWRITHNGQSSVATLSGADQFSDPVRITGVGLSRIFRWEITGAFTGTITFQRAFGEPTGWTDIIGYTTAGSHVATSGDGFDNQIVYYRLGFKSGGYTSGTPSVALTFAGGIQNGVVRITGVSSSTSASAEVIANMSQITATKQWAEGEWSTYRGFPGSVVFHDGRLWWGWRDRVYGSVSDAFDNFDANTEGDAGPIVRSVATGGFERIFWLLSIQRLLAGTGAQEISIRSSAFDEPLTPTQFTARASSDRGSADIQAIKVDSRGVFVQRSGKRVFEMVMDTGSQDFTSRDLTRLCPEICTEGVRAIAVQRQPDTRIWFVLDDGTCAVLTYEPDDEVAAWTTVETASGDKFRSVAVLPGEIEDEVWFVVKRTISGTDLHMIEKLARADECEGGALNKTMDCHLVYSGSSTTTISGLNHIIGRRVVVWSSGAPFVTLNDAPITVNGSGQITLPDSVTSAVIGLAYEGQFESAKLAYGAGAGTALLMKKKVSRLGLLMRKVGWKGVRIGRDFSNLLGLPTVYKGKSLIASQTLSEYDQSLMSFNGAWDTDSRVCFSVSSPYPATFMGLVVALETNEGLSMKSAQSDNG